MCKCCIISAPKFHVTSCLGLPESGADSVLVGAVTAGDVPARLMACVLHELSDFRHSVCKMAPELWVPACHLRLDASSVSVLCQLPGLKLSMQCIVVLMLFCSSVCGSRKRSGTAWVAVGFWKLLETFKCLDVCNRGELGSGISAI